MSSLTDRLSDEYNVVCRAKGTGTRRALLCEFHLAMDMRKDETTRLIYAAV